MRNYLIRNSKLNAHVYQWELAEAGRQQLAWKAGVVKKHT